jgi:hypothetical protein
VREEIVMRILLALFVAIAFSFAAPHASADELIVCGWDEVFIIDADASGPNAVKKLWSWRAADRPELPEAFRGLFRTTDDCKPVDGGRRILISASSGGCALVERETGNVLWYARVGNAHSIEMLPGGRIAVAGSVHAQGNRVCIFDVKRPNEELFHDELRSGHGVVWDAKRELLWALGYDELRAYRLRDWETASPKLEKAATYKLPDAGGHELSPAPDDDGLIVTTHEHVHVFDREKRVFSPYGPLQDHGHVKCVSVNPRTKRVAYVQAEGGEWWSPRVRFLEPAGELKLEGERIYKVRWVD